MMRGSILVGVLCLLLITLDGHAMELASGLCVEVHEDGQVLHGVIARIATQKTDGRQWVALIRDTGAIGTAWVEHVTVVPCSTIRWTEKALMELCRLGHGECP
jgi:hypothetical protein